MKVYTLISDICRLLDKYLKGKEEEQKYDEICHRLDELCGHVSNGQFDPNDFQKFYTLILPFFILDGHYSRLNGQIIRLCWIIQSRAHIYKTDIFKTMDYIFQYSKLIEDMEKKAVSNNHLRKLRRENNLFFGPCLSFLLILPKRVAACSCFELTGENFGSIVDWCREMMINHNRKKGSILQLVELCLPKLGKEEKLKLGNDAQFLAAALSNISPGIESEKKIFRDLSYESQECCLYFQSSKYTYGDVIEQPPTIIPLQQHIYSYELLRNAHIPGNVSKQVEDVSGKCFELLRVEQHVREAQYSAVEDDGSFLYVEKVYLMLNILVKKALHDDSLEINDAVKKLCFELPYEKIKSDMVKFIGYKEFIRACLMSKSGGPPAFGLIMIVILQRTDGNFHEIYEQNNFGPIILRLMKSRSGSDIIGDLVNEITEYFRYSGKDDLYYELRTGV
ncbi:hypothetical protein CAEBREN_12898 [Caenorhabditis brenneri]|uniref:Uncharacterized protein n=1 Tax=Caenorhabditis brenneri TaxID=135651 RepID=G0N4C1_CAEBE|nr:hypothetical protein CAEBREN_12898 [Caenorhabditis brenneri]